MGLWSNKKGMVANFSIIAQWDTMPGNIPAGDGKNQAEKFREGLPEMGGAVCGELSAKADMRGWENSMWSKAAKRGNVAYSKRMGKRGQHFAWTNKDSEKEQ
jgi:hypothetical protein